MQRERPHEIIPEVAIPPHKDHEYLRLTQAEQHVLKNKSPEDRGAWMREHMHTTEILARWLEASPRGLTALAARARGSEFDLNRSPHADPRGKLMGILEDAGLMEAATIIETGAFDTTEYETEQWADRRRTETLTEMCAEIAPDDPASVRRRMRDEMERRAGIPEKLRGPGPDGPPKAGGGDPLEGGIRPGELNIITAASPGEAVQGPEEDCEACGDEKPHGNSDNTGHPQTGLNP